VRNSDCGTLIQSSAIGSITVIVAHAIQRSRVLLCYSHTHTTQRMYVVVLEASLQTMYTIRCLPKPSIATTTAPAALLAILLVMFVCALFAHLCCHSALNHRHIVDLSHLHVYITALEAYMIVVHDCTLLIASYCWAALVLCFSKCLAK
jgi:hypothetical protein